MTEEQQDELLNTLQANVIDPEVSDLIYYPPGGIELTPEQIVDKALAYKRIML
ncbi:MAG: bacteriocin immunity protein [Candidatus Methylacidiphilales bacterium]